MLSLVGMVQHWWEDLEGSQHQAVGGTLAVEGSLAEPGSLRGEGGRTWLGSQNEWVNRKLDLCPAGLCGRS